MVFLFEMGLPLTENQRRELFCVDPAPNFAAEWNIRMLRRRYYLWKAGNIQFGSRNAIHVKRLDAETFG